MKQSSMDADRLKSEGRHSLHRRKMSKNSSVLNGDVESMDRTLVRELNYAVAAAFHDHLSCTKAAHEICALDTTSKEVRVNNLSCETDHIYANCSDTRSKTNVATRPSSPKEITSSEVSQIIISHSEIIGNLRKQLALKDQVIKRLRNHLDRNHRKHRMCLLQKRHPRQTVETTGKIQTNCTELNTNHSSFITSVDGQTSSIITPVLATRYFGRRSKTVPSRALKRRYLGPPKTVPVQRFAGTSSSLPSTSFISEKSKTISIQEVSESIPLKTLRKRGRKPKKVKRDHLTTDCAYFLPDNQSLLHSYCLPQIDVPLWKLKPVTSFYQMEGTENINDPVFERRHMKCELDERRRKRWDIQRLREQKVNQKLKYKYYREIDKDGENNIHRKPQSFYPDPRHIEFIEVTDIIPVLAFGHLIPLFQPSEFSLPWTCQDKQTLPVLDCNSNIKGKKSRHSTQATKVT